MQSEVLEGLATAANHRRWFVELAIPYLDEDPIEMAVAWATTRWNGPCTSPVSPRAKPITASLLVNPFGRCWLCRGTGNLRRKGRGRAPNVRCPRA